MRSLMLVLLAVAVCFGAQNWTGWGDTSAVAGLSGTLTKYSKCFDFGKYEDLAVVVKAADTVNAGFVSDSIAVAWGYQGGTQVLGTDGYVDTLWDPTIWVDTLLLDSLGKRPEGYQDSALYTHKNTGWLDTSMVTGFACQASGVVPEYRPLIRYVFKGLTGNCGTALRLQVQNVRRMGVRTVGLQ